MNYMKLQTADLEISKSDSNDSSLWWTFTNDEKGTTLMLQLNASFQTEHFELHYIKICISVFVCV